MKQELVNYLKRYKWLYVLAAICLIVDYCMFVVPTQITQSIIDAMGQQTLTQLILSSQLGLLLLCIGGMYAVQYIWVRCIYGRSSHYSYELKLRMYDKIVNMRTPFYDKFRSGDMMTRFTNDINAIKDLVGYGTMSIIMSVGVFGIVFPTMLSVSWRITLLSSIPFLMMIIPVIVLGKKQDIAVDEQREAVSQLSNEVLEVVEGIRVTRAYGSQAQAAKQFHKKTHALTQKDNLIRAYQAAYGRLSYVFMSLNIAIIILVGGAELEAGRVTVGELIALQLYATALVEPIWFLTDVILVYQAAKVSFGKVLELLNTGDDLEVDGVMPLAELKDFDMQAYEFQYAGANQPSLRNINLHIQRGQTIGIVGKTGSGKTTLVRQFLRQYPVGKGQFHVNQQAITDYQRSQIEQLIGYVPQEHMLFSRSVQENIAMGSEAATQKEIDVSVAIAAFSEDLGRMIQGYDTMIGEKGVAISGGQKQRISIARAVIREPEVLILDDALSAVDARTERQIIENIQTLRAGKTNIITTHRLSAVEHADWILVLDNGEVIEEGTASDLLAKRGWYYEQAVRQSVHEKEEAI